MPSVTCPCTPSGCPPEGCYRKLPAYCTPVYDGPPACVKCGLPTELVYLCLAGKHCAVRQPPKGKLSTTLLNRFKEALMTDTILTRLVKLFKSLPIRDLSAPGGELDTLRLREAARAILIELRQYEVPKGLADAVYNAHDGDMVLSANVGRSAQRLTAAFRRIIDSMIAEGPVSISRASMVSEMSEGATSDKGAGWGAPGSKVPFESIGAYNEADLVSACVRRIKALAAEQPPSFSMRGAAVKILLAIIETETEKGMAKYPPSLLQDAKKICISNDYDCEQLVTIQAERHISMPGIDPWHPPRDGWVVLANVWSAMPLWAFVANWLAAGRSYKK